MVLLYRGDIVKNKFILVITLVLVFLCCGCNDEDITKEKLLNIDFSTESNETHLDSYDTENEDCTGVEIRGGLTVRLPELYE